MMKTIAFLSLIFMISCAQERNLAKENQELLQLTSDLTEAVELQQQKAMAAAAAARNAQADAIAAQQEAEKSAQEASRQVQLRQEEVENLKKQLKNCN